MRQADLDRAVARATGESVSTIKRLGFLLDEPLPETVDADADVFGPYVLDWDEVEFRRFTDTHEEQRNVPALA
jgi:hypothetical protein